MSKFEGMIVARIVVDNYDFAEVHQKLTEKLSELDFVVATQIDAEEVDD